MENPHGPGWYIIHTRPLWEKKVENLLLRKKIEHYCPMKKVRKQGFRSVETVQESLFPSLIFVYCTPFELSGIKIINGVTNLVYWLQKPAIVPDEEIVTIKNFLGLYPEVLLEKTPMSISRTGTTISTAEIMQNGMNYFIKQQLPSLGYILKASISQQLITAADTIPAENFQQSPVTEFAM